MTPKFNTLKIKDLRKETDDCVSISFDVPDNLKNEYIYKSGQYLTLRSTIKNEDVRRSYSLCSAPFENEWRVAVKQVENGVFSSFANQDLKSGDELQVMTPMGNFLLNPESSAEKSYVLFAAGSGITPILSIAKTVLKEEPKSDVTLFYGNKGFSSIIFREELEALKSLHLANFRIIHVLSRESLGNKIQKGRIDAEKCAQLYDAFLKDQSIDAVYTCGPENMILDVEKTLIEKGVKKENIHFELFTSAGSAKKSEQKQTNEPSFDSSVSLILDGDTYDFNMSSQGKSILDAGYEAGADLPFACKGGVCCTCKAKIIEGSASMDVNYALDKDEVERGYILTCQAHPTSEKLVVSFDD
ncbi:MAG: 1,2-phenylacetyl-CoA epoxidase subunit PaaE [Bacteroidota bacterium]